MLIVLRRMSKVGICTERMHLGLRQVGEKLRRQQAVEIWPLNWVYIKPLCMGECKFMIIYCAVFIKYWCFELLRLRRSLLKTKVESEFSLFAVSFATWCCTGIMLGVNDGICYLF